MLALGWRLLAPKRRGIGAQRFVGSLRSAYPRDFVFQGRAVPLIPL